MGKENQIGLFLDIIEEDKKERNVHNGKEEEEFYMVML